MVNHFGIYFFQLSLGRGGGDAAISSWLDSHTKRSDAQDHSSIKKDIEACFDAQYITESLSSVKNRFPRNAMPTYNKFGVSDDYARKVS